jgi:hypothetical protein
MILEPLSLEELTRTAEALEQTGGNITRAAKLLGLNRQCVSRRIPVLIKRGIFVEAVATEKETDPTKPIKIFIIPDAQVKPGINLDHLTAAGEYAARKHPDVIVCIGDFADMESLSSYDIGKRCFEGRTYRADVDAATAGMKAFMTPVRREMKASGWNPRLVFTLGNHEDRITRAIELDRKLEGTISLTDLGYEKWGWEVHSFLEVVDIHGVMFSHYFTSGVMGRPITTAAAIISKKHQSCVAGHQQGRMVAYGTKADGTQMTAIICGSCYLHEEKFLGTQGNKHWRGFVMLHEVVNGASDEMFVSTNYILKYGKKGREQ